MDDQNTTATATRDPLLQPLTIGHLTLRNRIMSTSHACGLEEGGMPKERYQRYHEEKARGGLALTMFGGSSNVAPDSPNTFRQLNVGVDEVIPYLQSFSGRVHAQGAALMCQITHLGRRGDPYGDHWLPMIAPSPMRETLHRAFPKEMDEHDIARVVKAYGDAALRCKEGGLDGIETLAGGHIIGQFLSPLTNHRTDRFGGSMENRCRFAVMVHREMRRRVGDGFLIGMRYIVDEGDDAGLRLDDCIAAAKFIHAECGIDFFNAVYGKMDTERGLAVDNMPGMAMPLAPWVKPVGAFKRELDVPVFHAARLSDVASARYAVAEGLVDMAGMTRAQIADPYLVSKLTEGREEEIRPCIGATHCQSPHRPSCLHNAATGRETVLPQVIERSPRAGRKVVIVGGGPAGLEAARVSARRGHEVVLFEAAPELGGQVLIGSRGSWRRDLTGLVDWRAGELDRLGVDCRLNRYAEPEDVLAETPDMVVVATGGIPDLDWLPGAELCTSAWDALTGSVPLRDEVIVYDGTGRHPAPLNAELAAMEGKTVRFVSIDGYLAMELPYSERFNWKRRFYELGLTATFDHRLAGVAREGNRLRATFVNETTLETVSHVADQVIVEHGTAPVDELYHALRGQSANDGVTDIDALLALSPQPRALKPDAPFELHRIGDAVASRNIHAAIYDALRLCAAF
ncbi:NADH:flavin oxidoreductase [Kaustia mangrovi]|uniref:NADH:flavin oxidoreductase n=1 Tax=Kaustia mangrovi TaxID=2593653 RepID=A0A7S8C673_9HYPH|nr:NADH:flavin oxidoreductase [Kaustia mangrovi]QPC44140.1 NADH:flavin oxidoreductase [Kaustia mangrovi]